MVCDNRLTGVGFPVCSDILGYVTALVITGEDFEINESGSYIDQFNEGVYSTDPATRVYPLVGIGTNSSANQEAVVTTETFGSFSYKAKDAQIISNYQREAPLWVIKAWMNLDNLQNMRCFLIHNNNFISGERSFGGLRGFNCSLTVSPVGMIHSDGSTHPQITIQVNMGDMTTLIQNIKYVTFETTDVDEFVKTIDVSYMLATPAPSTTSVNLRITDYYSDNTVAGLTASDLVITNVRTNTVVPITSISQDEATGYYNITAVFVAGGRFRLDFSDTKKVSGYTFVGNQPI